MLDKEQKAAVEAKENKVIVVAGAGSGKTRVITERIKYLLDNGANPANIVCITFTNMAADEMIERLQGVRGIGDAFIGTIHSFANRVLKSSDSVEHFEIFNNEHNVKFHKYLINKYCKHLIFDRWLEYMKIKEDELCGKKQEGEADRFLTVAERAELMFIERNHNDIAPGDDFPKSVDSLCKAQNILTFDELLQRAVKYFDSHNIYPEYVLVDELQDIGCLEYNFIKSLRAKNYFFVGDDWQSIYSFKGGNVGIFKGLVEDKNWATYWLTNNYRNSKNVLKMAGHIIEQVSNKLEKKITPKNKSYGAAIVETKGAIDNMLATLAKDEKNFESWFFLVRTNRQVFELMEKCHLHRVPAITFKREGMSLDAMRGLLKSNAVKILTVHASKGLEADNVLLYGNFPVEQPPYIRNEEERKVMYVGVTRAKENLIILN